MAEIATANPSSEIAESRDPEIVRAMFDRVAWRYDLANHLLSAGCDFYWRWRASAIIAAWRPPCLLDIATGSGDLALAVRQKLPGSKIIGVDFSPDMLARAREKGLRDLILADALQLPFADQAFDAVTVAFGLRNMRDWATGLREMRRVLTRAGHLLVLDFSLPKADPVRGIYRFYLHHILPRLSALITGEKGAYDYLVASIEDFPSGHEMCRLLEANGFTNATAQTLTGGIVTIYSATAAV